MRIKPPSLGFLYLLLVLAAVSWLCAFLLTVPWHEHTGRDRDMARAAYLERIAPRTDAKRRQSWLNTALSVYIQYEEWESVLRLLETHKQFGLPATAGGIAELSQDEVWSFGLADDKWTKGHQYARFLIFNPKDRPQRYAFHWRTQGSSQAKCDPGNGEQRLFELVGKDWKEARVLVPTVAAKGFGFFSFKTVAGYSLPGKARVLGMQLDRIEFDVGG